MLRKLPAFGYGSVLDVERDLIAKQLEEKVSENRGEKMLFKCGCENPFQDEQYGNGMRVHSEKGNVHLDERFVDGLKDGKVKERDLPDRQYICTCGKTRYWWHRGGLKRYEQLFHRAQD